MQRRPYGQGHYSIEAYFKNIREVLSDEFDFSVVEAAWYSRGFIRRLLIMIQMSIRQGMVNHITGDIYFGSLLLRPARTVLTIHDCGIVLGAKGLKRAVLKLFWFWLPVRLADKVIAVSEATKSDIVKFTGCDPDKVEVIPVAIDAIYKYNYKEFNKERPILLQVGSACNKNLLRLIEAIRGMTVELWIVGPISEQTKMVLEGAHVIYRSYVNLSTEELYRLYCLCDIVTFISTYEGFGMPILEAQSVGRPVITSAISSMPEIARGGACLVDPYSIEDIRSGLKRIITDNDYRRSIVLEGVKNKERYSMIDCGRRYEAVYRSVINSVK